MEGLSKEDSPNGPGVTVLKIICGTFLFCICIVALSGPLLAKLDLWMDNLQHQIYTLIAVVVLTSIVCLKYWINKVRN